MDFFLTMCSLHITDYDHCTGVTCSEGLVCKSVRFRHQCMCPEGVTYYQPLGTNNCASKFSSDRNCNTYCNMKMVSCDIKVFCQK